MASRATPTASTAKFGIGIATAGRSSIAERCVALLSEQSRQPDAIIVCKPQSEAEDGSRLASGGRLTLIRGPRGSSHQRNCILEQAEDLDILLFLDDDFVMHRDYLAEIEEVFRACPEVVMTTGDVIADGILGPGLTFEEAGRTLAALPPARSGIRTVYCGYGCNMAVRMSAVRRRGARFDESLPLYAWLEDVDFSRTLAPAGRIVRVAQARGVHLGVKAARQSGFRLGYSQIANPCYLMAKGTCSIRKGMIQMGRNVAANVCGVARGDPIVDRKGRLAGNARAFVDLLSNRLAPARILTLPADPFAK